MLAPIQGQHTIALARAARSDASCSAAAPTGQTGMVDRSDRSRRVARRGSNERPPERDPVGADAPWVALGSAGQLGCPLTP